MWNDDVIGRSLPVLDEVQHDSDIPCSYLGGTMDATRIYFTKGGSQKMCLNLHLRDMVLDAR
jgi:hypothetical protein